MDKKNNSIIIIVAVVIIAVIAISVMKFGTKQPTPEPLSQTDIELNEAVTSDTTKSITDNLNNINLDDTVGDDELNIVDQELEKP